MSRDPTMDANALSDADQSETVTRDPHHPEEEEEIPEEIEIVVGLMLDGLQDKDTIVRWSAAKGLARLCERLSKEFADQVIESVIDLFAMDCIMQEGGSDAPSFQPDIINVSDSTWHGVCLCIAELSRRGLLVPSNLHRVVPWISIVSRFASYF